MIEPSPCPDEETILAFVEGRRTGAAADAVAGHLDGCESCRELVSAIAPIVLTATASGVGAVATPEVELPRGANVGRYVVLTRVGRGGMGDVYSAYDPELDRKVAIKLLHHGQGADVAGRARLLREAKAIARLSHPHVVVVHDAGTIDGRVFIAMEFVDGQTVAAWLAEGPKPWREVVAAFRDAGGALAAAHAAGVVHRDFKPHNVMFAADGSVRVMDFGLAAETGGAVAAGDGSRDADGVTVAADQAAATLTRTGTLLGTPAYMAPEQFLAETADARTDQFSFCVSLYEALFGERPFAGQTLSELTAEVLAGRVRDPQQRGRAPAWLRKLILRGLQRQRTLRWPSMKDLLRRLERDPDRDRRRALAAAGVAAVLVAGTVAVEHARAPHVALCGGAPRKAGLVWELASAGAATPRRDAVHAAFLATGAAFAESTWTRASRVLDDYVKRWSLMYTDACEATQLRGEQSAAVMELKMGCLDHALEGAGALSRAFAQADTDVVVHAVDAALSLPPLDQCSDVASLRAVVPPPRDQATRAQVDKLWRRSADLKALSDTGRYTEARQRGVTLLREAEAVGYGPLTAEAAITLGRLEADGGNMVVCGRLTERGFWAAFEARDDDRAAQAAATLAAVYGNEGSRGDVERWAHEGEALVARMGPGHDLWRAWVLQGRGLLAVAEHRAKDAEAAFREALAIKERLLGPEHPDVARSSDSLGMALVETGDLDGALAANNRSIDIVERVYGPDSPMSAVRYSNRAEIYNALHRPDDAIRDLRRSLRLWRPVAEDKSAALGYPLTALGQALLLANRSGEAVAPLEEALRLREAEPVVRINRGETRFALARALAARGGPDDVARAIRLAAAARDDYAHVDGRAGDVQAIEAWQAEQRRRAHAAAR